jgi:gliding motility-associated lipoprotein GldH
MSSVKNKGILALLVLLLASCSSNNLADTNVEMPALNWLYTNKITAVVNVKEINKPYNIYFKLRHSANYRYANLYILLHFTAPGKKTITTRYQFKLAKPDGQWLGKGSGNLFSYNLPLLTNYKFAKAGSYTLAIEQNMRDNPLPEISDVGIMVSPVE